MCCPQTQKVSTFITNKQTNERKARNNKQKCQSKNTSNNITYPRKSRKLSTPPWRQRRRSRFRSWLVFARASVLLIFFYIYIFASCNLRACFFGVSGDMRMVKIDIVRWIARARFVRDRFRSHSSSFRCLYRPLCHAHVFARLYSISESGLNARVCLKSDGFGKSENSLSFLERS